MGWILRGVLIAGRILRFRVLGWSPSLRWYTAEMVSTLDLQVLLASRWPWTDPSFEHVSPRLGRSDLVDLGIF